MNRRGFFGGILGLVFGAKAAPALMTVEGSPLKFHPDAFSFVMAPLNCSYPIHNLGSGYRGNFIVGSRDYWDNIYDYTPSQQFLPFEEDVQNEERFEW